MHIFYSDSLLHFYIDDRYLFIIFLKLVIFEYDFFKKKLLLVFEIL